jgi:hypothetical protein
VKQLLLLLCLVLLNLQEGEAAVEAAIAQVLQHASLQHQPSR